MSIMGEIQALFKDRARTQALFPVTKVKAVSDDNGTGLDAILSDQLAYTKKIGNPHNLLDNSDFRNPVNQRGITTHNGGGYSIDRWFTTGGENGEQFQVSVEDGYVKLYNGSDVQHGLEQRFVHGILDQNKVYTVAYKDYYGNVVVSRASIGYYPEYGMDALYFPLNPGETRPVVWIALYEGEYTAETLPEYQPKGYGAELAECQRYYQVLPFKLMTATSEAKVLPGREYKVPMRVVPTATIFTPAGDGYIATWGNDTAFTVESVYTQQDSIVYVTTNEQTTVGKPIGYGVKLSADL